MTDCCRKVLKRIKVGEIQPNETIEAVKEATLLAKVQYVIYNSFVIDTL